MNGVSGSGRAPRGPVVAVAGMGLIGGSFYKASVRAGYETIGLHHGESAGLERADIVLVALPPEATAPWIRGHARRFKSGSTVVDACGVKSALCAEMSAIPQDGWRFVGGHPMAGKEVSGFENSSEDLFDGRSMILVPPDDLDEKRRAALERFFASLGFSRVVVTTPGRHDAMIAFTSQLGHVIASAYAQDPRMSDSVGFSAGSFANMTRIATADPDTWASLYLSNRGELLAAVDGFMARMAAFRSALERRDVGAIREFVAAGAEAKRRELESERRG